MSVSSTPDWRAGGACRYPTGDGEHMATLVECRQDRDRRGSRSRPGRTLVDISTVRPTMNRIVRQNRISCRARSTCSFSKTLALEPITAWASRSVSSRCRAMCCVSTRGRSTLFSIGWSDGLDRLGMGRIENNRQAKSTTSAHRPPPTDRRARELARMTDAVTPDPADRAVMSSR